MNLRIIGPIASGKVTMVMSWSEKFHIPIEIISIFPSTGLSELEERLKTFHPDGRNWIFTGMESAPTSVKAFLDRLESMSPYNVWLISTR